MQTIPETGFVRLPVILSVIPVSKTVWYRGVKSGRFPKGIKLSYRCTAWRAEDILAVIEELGRPLDGSVQPITKPVARSFKSQ